MSEKVIIAIAQLNPVVGDFEGNRKKILEHYQDAAKGGADLVAFTELTITGYAPEDLVLRPRFQQDSLEVTYSLAAATKDYKAAILVGGLSIKDGNLYNSVFLLENGEIKHIFSKYDLPNYGVFDEKRVFAAANLPQAVTWRGIRLGVIICEDTWNLDVARSLAAQKIELLLSLNASPYEIGKKGKRLERTRSNVVITKTPLIYTNQVCGQDDVVYDGGSLVLDHEGFIVTQLPHWKEAIQLTEWEKQSDGKWHCMTHAMARTPSKEENIYQAMILSLRDYVAKNGFPGVILGLSGGIDSALTAAVAVDALGKERVWCVLMPSEFTSQESMDDAAYVAVALGVKYDIIPITPMFEAYKSALAQPFAGKKEDVTEENLQSRIRGGLLMALSNKFGYMVLSTGNKSEMATGYATLYGDMCGGYNVLKDTYKTEVYKLSRWRNEHLPERGFGPKGKVISENIIVKAPTAELRHDQKDQDSLPPYDILDNILYQLVELRKSGDDLIESGYDKDIVHKVVKLLYQAEYKRRQSAPGTKITTMQFGRDRRYPITHKYTY